MKAEVTLEHKNHLSVKAENDREALKAATDYLTKRNKHLDWDKCKETTGKIKCVAYPLYHVKIRLF